MMKRTILSRLPIVANLCGSKNFSYVVGSEKLCERWADVLPDKPFFNLFQKKETLLNWFLSISSMKIFSAGFCSCFNVATLLSASVVGRVTF